MPCTCFQVHMIFFILGLRHHQLRWPVGHLDAGEAGMPGMLAKLARMQRMLAGMLATVRGDLHGIYSVF